MVYLYSVGIDLIHKQII